MSILRLKHVGHLPRMKSPGLHTNSQEKFEPGVLRGPTLLGGVGNIAYLTKSPQFELEESLGHRGLGNVAQWGGGIRPEEMKYDKPILSSG
ncbi:hypothetical protein B0H16DRAFT_1696396 [Mycena metata]|uniref:Uncharacterized protein n=1 Tax=Mycena metata TaxID=1033252 RepID=A0AAD7MUD0_9AGAR|nr:hypothetical protein B0H16DRAFT_1696396 [Mycena metata]